MLTRLTLARCVPSIFVAFLMVASPVSILRAGESTIGSEANPAFSTEIFESKIRAIFVEKCQSCHSDDEFAESSLSFSSRAKLLSGADFGPAIIPGRAAESLLIQAVKWTHKELKMPPDEEDRLTQEEIEDLTDWIDAGAPWPQGVESSNDPEDLLDLPINGRQLETEHWAFQPRKTVSPPAVEDALWMESGIDRFVEAKRQAQGLTATRLADRQTLIRRATFDLTGLPPSPAEVQSFVNDRRSDSVVFADLVDRLLASPRYGERWGRHWLDVARYADTQGEVGDIPIPSAYRYRDWVIDSLNDDMPYDEFLRAQIAGDLIEKSSLTSNEEGDLTVATGFIALSRRFGNKKQQSLHLTIENTIDTLGRAVLGVTLRCARCHDHRFDPVLQTDYFGLYGIFASTEYPWMGTSDERSPSGLVPTGMYDDSSRAQIENYWKRIAELEYQIKHHHRSWLKPTLDRYKIVEAQLKEEEISEEVRSSLLKEQQELLSRHDGKFCDLLSNGLKWVNLERKRIASNPPAEFVFGVSEGDCGDVRLHLRGDPENLGRPVPRRFLQVLDGPEAPQVSGSGRMELAEWLTAPDHPLVARVLVNRVWQRHFGRGIVETSDDFGAQGSLPTHPELLDWLSNQFILDGWSLKSLHRRIMLSRIYCLASSSDFDLEGKQQDTRVELSDPDNQFLCRFPRRRLEAEPIRDAMLAVNGTLDLDGRGPHSLRGWYEQRYSLNRPFHEEFETNHRSVFLLTQRLYKHSFLGLFDGPDTNECTSSRSDSDLAGQALFLMNSEFVDQQSKAFADRLLTEAGNDTERIHRAFWLAYSRAPTEQEVQGLLLFIGQMMDSHTNATPEVAKHATWTSIARVIFSSNEFVFID